MTDASLPRLLVFSEGALARSHGTGAIFARNFASYPPDRLTNAFFGPSAEPLVARRLDLNRARWPARGWWPPVVPVAKVWNASVRRVVGRTWSVPVNGAALRAAVAGQRDAFDLIYAIVYSRTGLDTLREIHAGLGGRLPLVLQIQDFYPHAALGFWRAFDRLAPFVTEVWAVSESIARIVELYLQRPVLVDPLFHLDLPAAFKADHRPLAAGFRAVILGNIWQPGLLDDVKAVWQRARREHPALPAILWHCHPSGVAAMRAAGRDPAPEVEPAPFLTGDALFAMLREADLALVPFSRGRRPATDYERFSMPSRLTEICAAGLPVFGFTGDATPLADYVRRHGIGRCGPSARTTATAADLVRFMADAGARAQCGRAARALAEREFPLAPFQDWLHGRLRELARTSAHPSPA